MEFFLKILPIKVKFYKKIKHKTTKRFVSIKNYSTLITPLCRLQYEIFGFIWKELKLHGKGKIIIALQKNICGLLKCTPNVVTQFLQ